MKTKKSLIKRLKITKKNKWVVKSANTSHLSASKSKKQKKRLDKTSVVKKVDQKRLRKLLG